MALNKIIEISDAASWFGQLDSLMFAFENSQ